MWGVFTCVRWQVTVIPYGKRHSDNMGFHWHLYRTIDLITFCCYSPSHVHSCFEILSKLDQFVWRVYFNSSTKMNTIGERKFGTCDTWTFLRFCRSWVQLFQTIHQYIHAVLQALWSAVITTYVQMLLQVCPSYFYTSLLNNLLINLIDRISWLSWWCSGSAPDSWSKSCWFDSRLGCYQVN